MGNLIYIVGIGPGESAGMTAQARAVLEKSDIIIGYTLYVKLVEKNFPGKEFMTTGMRQEMDRCRLCFEKAGEGKIVALICSGDAGVYGMASPMYELSREYPETELVVIPGITAANSGAAILGAPLNHDYCLISLSDLMTPWSVIEKRLQAAILGDFAIALYNPSSKKRSDYLEKACRIMMEAGAAPDRACGYVENIGREGTKHHVCTLAELAKTSVNMFTTVFIGNSRSCIMKEHLVTKRGYEIDV
ncbi:MAG: precorrin-3B C(17)-methyltransferase [Lachnospiraceae bacterium]|nr:precorrin-3B C(17)-methyltransferase [Lachnospiraceae bacterium]